MAVARLVPLDLVKGPAFLQLHLDLLARLGEDVLLELDLMRVRFREG